MKKRWGVVLGLVLAAAAAGGGYWYYQEYYPVQSTENAVYVTSVESMTSADNGFLNRYAGVVEAQETLEVKIESGRKVGTVEVKAGDVVKKGQLLFEYDLSSIEQDLKEAELDLEKLKNEANSLTQQIATLEKEQKKAKQENQLSYTIEIETAKMNLKKNEYDQISKTSQIERLQSATGNTEVRSEIDGVVQKIDTSKMESSDGESVQDTLDSYGSYDVGSNSNNAFITILSTGEYRVKGTVNELNMNALFEGVPVIIRSRAEETQTWKGMISLIDRDNPNSSSQNEYWGMMSTGSDETRTSTYPFYVQLENSDGLMLGQHVYIEPDNGQDAVKSGLWISEVYVSDADTEHPYVWVSNDKNRLEKRNVTLGEHDEVLGEYEILDGLSKKDYIAYPDGTLEEGMPATTDIAVLMNNDMDAELPDVQMDTMTEEDLDLGNVPVTEIDNPEDLEAFSEGVSEEVSEEMQDMSGSMDDMNNIGNIDDSASAEGVVEGTVQETNEDIPEMNIDDIDSNLSPVVIDGMEELP